MTDSSGKRNGTVQPARGRHAGEAMRRYSQYLKNRNRPIRDEERYRRTPLYAWRSLPVCYPPFED